MGFLTRQPGSNEIPSSQANPWGSQDDCYDDVAVLLNGGGKRCCVCQRVVLNSHILQKDGRNYCPDHASAGASKLPPIHPEKRFWGASSDSDFDAD